MSKSRYETLKLELGSYVYTYRLDWKKMEVHLVIKKVLFELINYNSYRLTDCDPIYFLRQYPELKSSRMQKLQDQFTELFK